MEVVVVLNFARSGGTLLNKCLSASEETIVLSEINPNGGGTGKNENSFDTIKKQLKHWYNISISSGSFKEEITELIHKNTNKRIIIRDWSYLDFFPYKKNNYSPKQKFTILEELKSIEGLDIKILGLVRNSIDVWLSTGHKKLDNFILYYSVFINELIKLKIPIFKYEDLTSDPEKTISSIYQHCDLNFQRSILSKAVDIQNVNGDIQDNNSRGEKQKRIVPLKRKIVPYKIVKEIEKNSLIKKTNKLFGYSGSYFDNLYRVEYCMKRTLQIAKRYF